MTGEPERADDEAFDSLQFAEDADGQPTKPKEILAQESASALKKSKTGGLPTWRERLPAEPFRTFYEDRKNLTKDRFLELNPTPFIVTHALRDPVALDAAKIMPVAKREEGAPQGDPIVIGRDKTADLVIPCSTVSKKHASFTLKDGVWSLNDMSTNGTLVGETLVENGKSTELTQTPVELALGPDARLWFFLPGDLFGAMVELDASQPDAAAEQAAPVFDGGDGPSFSLAVSFEGNEIIRRTFSQTDVRIGRDPQNDLPLDHPALSRAHAVIRREGAVFVLSDLQSQNGTFVNGQKVSTKPLNHGDEILVGEFRLAFATSRVVDLAVDKSDHAALGQTLQLATGANADQATLERTSTVRAHFVVEPGGEALRLDRDVFLIGKGAGCDLKVGGYFGARVAAAVVRGQGGFWFVSLGAQGRKNGARVGDRVALEHGDVVEVGGSRRLVFHLGQPIRGG